ncbi:MAG: sensor histidine kinase, partial [Propionibacteriaceae bacterium]
LQRWFGADAGHELRTPLTLLSTRAQLLARRVRSGSGPTTADPDRDRLVARDADGIIADTTTLAAVLEELLLAADVRTPVPQEPVDLGALVATAVAAAQAAAESAGLTLTLRPTNGPTTITAGAPTALGRSVTALIDNALGHARRAVVVAIAREGRSLVIEVTDDGPGIPSDTLPWMFDRFASGRPVPQDAGERRHFGLGLALVSEIATRHGGTVAATNRPAPDNGAVLRLALPVEGRRAQPGYRRGRDGPAVGS